MLRRAAAWVRARNGKSIWDETTVYGREHGVIAYEVALVWGRQPLDQLPAVLLESGLTWYWQSWQNLPVADDSPVQDSPAERPLTLLSAATRGALIDDFRERNVDGYRRTIVLFGGDTQFADGGFEPPQRNLLLKRFTEQEEGPLRMVLVALNDGVEYLFVPQRPIEPVQRLLEFWRLVPAEQYR